MNRKDNFRELNLNIKDILNNLTKFLSIQEKKKFLQIIF